MHLFYQQMSQILNSWYVQTLSMVVVIQPEVGIKLHKPFISHKGMGSYDKSPRDDITKQRKMRHNKYCSCDFQCLDCNSFYFFYCDTSRDRISGYQHWSLPQLGQNAFVFCSKKKRMLKNLLHYQSQFWLQPTNAWTQLSWMCPPRNYDKFCLQHMKN